MKASDNDYPSLLLTEGTTPSTPAASHDRLFVRSSDHVLCLVNSSGTVSTVGSTASLTSVDASLGADVTMTTASTFYDGPSASFAAGTWLIVWKALIKIVGTGPIEYHVKLWDGSTVYDEGHNDQAGNGSTTYHRSVIGHALVTLGSTTTLKISASSDTNSQVLQRDPTFGSASSHTPTRLTGVKIA